MTWLLLFLFALQTGQLFATVIYDTENRGFVFVVQESEFIYMFVSVCVFKYWYVYTSVHIHIYAHSDHMELYFS